MASKRRIYAIVTFFSLLLLTGCPSSLTSSEDSSTPTSTETSSQTTSETTSLPPSSEVVQNYTITFDTNGGTPIEPMTAPAGSSINPPASTTKVGHTFIGWFADSALTIEYFFTTMPNENITVYAKWEINSYTIMFEENGGSTVPDITLPYGSAVSAPTDPTKTGYSFAGWFANGDLTIPYEFTTMPAGSITVYAKWNINSYTLTFNTNGGSAIAPITQDYNTPISAPTEPTKTGHTFAGWFADTDLTIPFVFSMMPAGNTTIYAKWTINSYTISFDSNGGSPVTSITQAYNTAVSAPSDPTKEGYTFAGWYSDTDLTLPYTFTVMPAGSMTLYAKWTPDQVSDVMTIAEFKDLPVSEGNPHSIRGVVFFAESSVGIIVIADSTDTIFVVSNADVALFDLVKVTGYRVDIEGFVVIGDEFGGATTPVTVEDHEQPMPIDPEVMSVAQYNTLEEGNPSNWGRFIEVSGLLELDNESPFTLTSGTDTMVVMPFGMEPYMMLANYDGFNVKISGVTLPNMDTSPATMMFIFNGEESFIKLDYDDNELLEQLEGLFRAHFEAPTYYPGQIIDLPTEHDMFELTVSYETFGINASRLDLLTNQIDPLIDEALEIDLRVHVTLISGSSRTFEIKIKVDPDVFISIADLKAQPDSETVLHVINVVVLFIQPTEDGMNMIMVADATGVIYINSSEDWIEVGDRIIAIGYKMTMGSMVIMFNEPTKTVDLFISHNNPMPMTPTPISVADFLLLSPSDPGANFTFYELTGTLMYLDPENPSESMYGLVSGSDTVMIFAPDAASRTALDAHINELVTIQAMAFLAGEAGSYIVILAYLPFPNTIISAT